MCQGGGKPDTGKFHSSYIGMDVCGSIYKNGCACYGSRLSIIIIKYLPPKLCQVRTKKRIQCTGVYQPLKACDIHSLHYLDS